MPHAMQDAAQPTATQLLFMELRVGLARSAIQSCLVINGIAAIAVLLFIAILVSSPAPTAARVDVNLVKWSVAAFGSGIVLAGITFVNAYIAHGALASGRSGALGDVIRRLGLCLILASLALFLAGLAIVVAAL